VSIAARFMLIFTKNIENVKYCEVDKDLVIIVLYTYDPRTLPKGSQICKIALTA
jgi:hypothetical protein